MVRDGYEITVITEYPEETILNGVRVVPQVYRVESREIPETDIIFTHLGRTGRAINNGVYFQKPVLVFFHSTLTNHYIRNKPGTHLVFNSEHSRRGMNMSGTILHPIVDIDPFPIKGKYVTLVNCNENKGGKFMIELAKNLPSVQFKGVKGGYGDQFTEDLPNLHYIETAKTKDAIYGDSRMVICPSKYESYSMVAVEAAMLGIPVVTSEAEGFKESIGERLPLKLDLWIEKIYNLYHDKERQVLETESIKIRQNVEYKIFLYYLNKIYDSQISKKAQRERADVLER